MEEEDFIPTLAGGELGFAFESCFSVDKAFGDLLPRDKSKVLNCYYLHLEHPHSAEPAR